MKKILTLLLSLGIFSATFAQRPHHEKSWNDRDNAFSGHYDRYDRRYNNNRNYSFESRRALEIQRINQNYQYQMMSIQNNRYMRNHQKKVAMRNIQRERVREIQRLNEKYNHMNRNWGRR